MDMADLSALLGADATATTYADVWAVLPPSATSAKAVAETASLLGEARRLGDSLGCYVNAVVASEAAGEPAIALGADRAHVSADAVEYLTSQQPEFVLFPASLNTQAAQLAERLDAGLITNVQAPLTVDPETRALSAAHPVYGGDYFHQLVVTSPAKLATLDLDAFPAAQPEAGRTGEIRLSETAEPAGLQPIDLGPADDYAPPVWRPLSRARVIVAGGRGLRDEEGFAMLRRLAACLGAEVAGDRSARDSGWVDEAHEVGVTAQEVAPDVYVAVGILGDTIHNAAIASARNVIAIHANPEAPIFKVADLAIVAEPKAILPVIIEAVSA